MEDDRARPCPRCFRKLVPIGDAVLRKERFLVYQCDDCLIPTKSPGEPNAATLAFAVSGTGQIVDLDGLDRPPPWWES